MEIATLPTMLAVDGAWVYLVHTIDDGERAPTGKMYRIDKRGGQAEVLYDFHGRLDNFSNPNQDDQSLYALVFGRDNTKIVQFDKSGKGSKVLIEGHDLRTLLVLDDHIYWSNGRSEVFVANKDGRNQRRLSAPSDKPDFGPVLQILGGQREIVVFTLTEIFRAAVGDTGLMFVAEIEEACGAAVVGGDLIHWDAAVGGVYRTALDGSSATKKVSDAELPCRTPFWADRGIFADFALASLPFFENGLGSRRRPEIGNSMVVDADAIYFPEGGLNAPKIIVRVSYEELMAAEKAAAVAAAAPWSEPGDPLAGKELPPWTDYAPGLLSTSTVKSVLHTFAESVSTMICFSSLRRHIVAGTVTLNLFIEPDGRVTEVAITSDLGDVGVENCLAKEARAVTFPPVSGGRRARVHHKFLYNGPKIVEGVSPQANDSIPKDLSHCRKLPGADLVAVVWVNDRGRVESVGLSSAFPIPPRMHSCLVKNIRGWRLPKSPRGTVSRAAWKIE
jgi:hypothetical protein